MNEYWPHDGHDPLPEHSGGPADASTLVRLRTPSEVVTAVPFLLGYVPEDSVVLLAFTRRRLQVTVCLPWPVVADASEGAAILTATLATVDVSGVMVVGYGDTDTAAALLALADGLAWPVLDVLRVHAGRWWCLTCTDCCPSGAQVVPEDEITVPLMVANGSPAPTRDALAIGLAPAPRAVLDRVSVLLADTADPDEEPDRLYAALVAAKTARADRRTRLGTAEAAELLHGLRSLVVRDSCAVWHDGGALNLWSVLLPLAPAGWVAPVATLLALTAYQQGDGTLAGLALQRALHDEPEYSLAGLLLQIITHGISPSTVTDILRRAQRQLPPLGGPPTEAD